MIKTPQNHEITFIDASRISCIGRCEARYYFQHVLGLTPPKDPTKLSGNIYLDYGTIMHRVLPFMYSGKVEDALSTFNTLWAKYGYGEDDLGRNTFLSHRRIFDFIATHKPSICQYQIEHFAFSSPAELISPNEVPFLIDVGAIYPLAGRIDAVVTLGSTRSTFAYDFKTASEISDRYFENFWFAPQACAYTVALAQIINKPVEGLLLEAMRISKAKIQEVGKQIESQMRPIYVHQNNINTFLDELKLTCARIEAANATGAWRQNHALCSSYSGFGFPGSTCEYKLLCDSSDWQSESRFFDQKKPFNPLDEKE